MNGIARRRPGNKIELNIVSYPESKIRRCHFRSFSLFAARQLTQLFSSKYDRILAPKAINRFEMFRLTYFLALPLVLPSTLAFSSAFVGRSRLQQTSRTYAAAKASPLSKASALFMKTIAVIGASGLTAQECVYQALKNGDTVIGLTRCVLEQNYRKVSFCLVDEQISHILTIMFLIRNVETQRMWSFQKDPVGLMLVSL